MLFRSELIESFEAPEQKLFRHKESSLENIFQSKLKIFDKDPQRESSSRAQVKRESFRSENQSRGKEKKYERKRKENK